MKAVILAGGRGSRIAEESGIRPKPLIEIGGYPILWHIMKIYAHHGIRDFVICVGYKGYLIKEYFANFVLHHSDVTFDMTDRSVEFHDRSVPPWRVSVVDTGQETQTAGRLKRAAPYLRPDETFCLTYGDGVGAVDIGASIAFHRRQALSATVTVVRPPARFGAVVVSGDRITEFHEKRHLSEGGFINGGFFVLEPRVLDLIEGDTSVWEAGPLETLARRSDLASFRHDGFWQPMDTLRDKNLLEELWASGKAPWKVWTD